MSSYPFTQSQAESQQAVESSQSAGWSEESTVRESIYQEQQAVTYPDIDMVDTSEEVIAYVDLPGFTADDISVRIDQQTLAIEASRNSELEETDTVVLNERPTTVERVVTLPAAVRAGGAEAELNDGVCMVSLPKADADRYEEIRVSSD